MQHAISEWFAIPFDECNSQEGCWVATQDQIYSGEKGTPYSDGEFDWPVPHQYCGDDGVPHQIVVTHHNQVADPAGKCTIQKQGAGPVSANASDPSSDW